MRKKRAILSNSKLKYFLLILVAVVAVFTILELTNTVDVINKQSNSETAETTDRNISSSGDNSDGQDSEDEDAEEVFTPESNKRPATSPQANINLIKPSGDFVSTHNLSYGKYKNDDLSSVCITSSGASCYISFSNNGIIKSLPAEKADANGSVYWTWTLKKLRITQGTWQVKAVATYGSQTKTASDATPLIVKP